MSQQQLVDTYVFGVQYRQKVYHVISHSVDIQHSAKRKLRRRDKHAKQQNAKHPLDIHTHDGQFISDLWHILLF